MTCVQLGVSPFVLGVLQSAHEEQLCFPGTEDKPRWVSAHLAASQIVVLGRGDAPEPGEAGACSLLPLLALWLNF